MKIDDQLDVNFLPMQDRLGFCIEIENRSLSAITVAEPHPHTNIHLYAENGDRHPQCRGAFAPQPRWQLTLNGGDKTERIVFLPDWYLDATGTFMIVAALPLGYGDSCNQTISCRRPIELRLPTFDEYYEGEAGKRCHALLHELQSRRFVVN